MESIKQLPKLLGRRELHRPDQPIVALKDITVRYNDRLALEAVSLDLIEGEQIAVVGPNGAGKSTLFRVIAGVLHPTSGTVTVYGYGPSDHICIAYVPQRSQVDWAFPVDVADAVMMGRVGKMGLFRRPKRPDWDHVRSCLEVVGMVDLAHRQIGELSGGQQQRVFIARALAQEAELMLMDEPLTGLDMPAQEGIFRVLERLRQHRVTVMVATHDLDLAARRFDRVMLLNRQLLGIGQAQQVFSPDNLMAAYGGQLRLITTDEGTVVLSDTCCEGE